MSKTLKKIAFAMAGFYTAFVMGTALLSGGEVKEATKVYRNDGIYSVGVDVRQSAKDWDYNLKCGSKTLDQGESLNVYVDEGYGIYKIYMNGKSVNYDYAGFDSTKYRNRFTCTMPAENVIVSADIVDALVVNPLKYNTYKTGTFGNKGEEVSADKFNFSGTSIIAGYLTADSKPNEDEKTAKLNAKDLTFKVISKGSFSTKNSIIIEANYHGTTTQFTVYESKGASANGQTEAGKKAPSKSESSSNKTSILKPAKVKLTSAKSKKKKITVKWKKISSVAGYEIAISTKKSKGYKKAATVSAKKKSYTIKKFSKKALKKKKKYYVKVRAYKKSGSTKVYGSYSKIRTVKCK